MNYSKTIKATNSKGKEIECEIHVLPKITLALDNSLAHFREDFKNPMQEYPLPVATVRLIFRGQAIRTFDILDYKRILPDLLPTYEPKAIRIIQQLSLTWDSRPTFSKQITELGFSPML